MGISFSLFLGLILNTPKLDAAQYEIAPSPPKNAPKPRKNPKSLAAAHHERYGIRNRTTFCGNFFIIRQAFRKQGLILPL